MDPKPEEDADLLEVMPSQPSAPPPPLASSAGPSAGRIRSKNCDVRGCNSNSLRNPELLFVAVPGQNAPERRFVWLTLMQAIRDKKRSYVCSRHFAVPEDFKDFHEFITAPPGYKRQLMVKRGVVPHFNMPPLNIPGLPPLNDHWQLTLPVRMTETDQIRQARVSEMFGGGHLQGPAETSVASNNRSVACTNPQASPVKRAVKAVQTETVFSSGQRKMQASLQYCRLCLQRQDLEPIFTGDQTLIEPDLIDKIYGCTQILITIENDFPSSICTNCYQNVQHFITFRRSVQKNDQSLRSTAATIGTFKPAPCPPLPAPTSSSPAAVTAVPARTKTIGKVTPMRPVPTASAPVRASLASPQCPGIVPLAPWSLPKSQTVQQQPASQRPRVYAPQRTIIRKLPLDQSKDTSGNAADIDPFANVEESSVAGWDNQQEGVQMADRVVPVTLIRVQPEREEEEEEDDEVVEIPNEPEQTQPAEDNSRRNFLQPKPLEQLLENARKSATETEPEVLQAVELIPSAVAQEVVKQRNAPKIFLRKAPVPTKRLSPVSTLSKVKDTPKFSTVPKVVRAVKFPGTLTTLFSGVRKPAKSLKSTASPELTKFKAVVSPKPVESPKPESSVLEKQKPAPQPKPKAPTPTAQILKEVKVPEESPKAPIRPKPKLLPSTKPKQKENEPTRPKPKQKENDIPESPQSETSTVPEVASPRSARARKIPAKFQDTVGFPMPIIVIKPDPDTPPKDEETPRAKLPEVKSASELPELRVRVQDARARHPAGKPAEAIPKTRLSAGKTQTPVITKEPEKKVQAVKVKEVEKKPVNPVLKSKEPVKSVAKSAPVPPAKPKEVEKKSSKVQIAVKEKVMRGRPSKEAPPEEPPARSTKRKSIPDAKESPRTKRASLETAPPKVSKPNGSRQSAPAKTSPAAPVATPAPRASACPFCSNRTFDEKKALVKHLRKRHGMDYATVRQRLAIYGGNW
ncbi:hypothetical protein quinque_013016 [Culex quinquefasciatus]|uniref:titin n=1 Tax=Culex quinquefasciatus TaxID=7176 RepID=UPI0018E3B61D|nr:titin [Culex quinquefasciatus]